MRAFFSERTAHTEALQSENASPGAEIRPVHTRPGPEYVNAGGERRPVHTRPGPEYASAGDE